MFDTIETTQDTAKLDQWLDNFATAKKLADVRIGQNRAPCSRRIAPIRASTPSIASSSV
jgi:hypothetical protein